MLAFLITNRKLVAILGAVALCMFLGWRIHKLITDAEKARELENAINDHLKQTEQSHTIGMNLETGLNDYDTVKRPIDRRLNHAISNDTGNRFTPDSVQRVKDRIAAGESARKRAD